MRDTLLTRSLVRLPWIGPRAAYRLQRAGRGVPDRHWAEVADAAARSRPDVVSVDVFDTCLVRDLVGDHAVERVIDHLAPAGGDGREGSADRVERALCRPVPGAADALTRIRKSEAEVVFLSDTDRSSDLLTDILRSHQLFVDGDRLVASCEAGATKSRGDLFHRVFRDHGSNGDGRSVWHVGNHLWADVTMAAAAGVSPIPLRDADANRYERAMAARPGGYGPAVAGAARLARLEVEHERRAGRLDDREAALRVLGADVAGQAMTAFVLWVAERSRAEGIEHLGFLARDGELPLEVARALPPDHWEGRTLRYLHCSRLTWSLAAASVSGLEQWLQEGTRDDEAFLHAKRHHVPFEALLSRIGLRPADLAGSTTHRPLAALAPGQTLPEHAVDDWSALLADPAIHDRIAERADERLKLIIDRLRAEGTPAGKFGLVDVGWRGRLATQVSAVLTQVVGQEPVHFHFGGDKVLPDVDGQVPIRRFAFDGVSDPHPIAAPVSCIETLTASGKPRVIEYRRAADGHVELIFDDPPGGSEGSRGQLWAGAVRASSLVPSRATLQGWGLRPDSLADEAIAVLDLWWNRPTRREVEALDGLTFEHDEAGTALRPLITPYRLGHLRPDVGAARQWPQGSAVASRPFMSAVARTVHQLRSLRRRYRR